MRSRANELARSGQYGGYASIMAQLRSEFDRDPHFIFEHPRAKDEFDEICRRATHRDG